MNEKQRAMLVEDLESQKTYEAYTFTGCDCCGETIEEGEEFVFMGNRRKVCLKCLGEMQWRVRHE